MDLACSDGRSLLRFFIRLEFSPRSIDDRDSSAINHRVQYAIVRKGYTTRRLADFGKRQLARRKETFPFNDGTFLFSMLVE